MISAAFASLLFLAAAGQPANPDPHAQHAPDTQAEATAAPAEAEQQAADPRDVVRCQRRAETGSRLATTRVCMSEREEQRLRSETAHTMREIRTNSVSGTSGGQ